MPPNKYYQSAPTVNPSTGSDVTSPRHRVHAYVLLEDGTNGGILEIYKNSVLAANLLWKDEVVAGDKAKTFKFEDPSLGGDDDADTLVLRVLNTGASARVQIS